MVDRRGFLKGSAALAATAAGGGQLLGACAPTPSPRPVVPYGPAGEVGIDHIVVVMMENRSLDHLLGWVPGVDGKQAGLTFVDNDGTVHETHHMTEFVTCEYQDPDHSYDGGRVELNGGACDGFLLTSKDTFPIGYYEQDDLPTLGRLAPAWTVCDRYFAATMGPTFPNRIYQHAGATDRGHNTIDICQLPTIWDRMKAKRLAARYYYVDAPVTALWGLSHADISHPFDTFLSDCRAGTLPHLSFVDPKLLIAGPIGTSADYHPHSDIRAGEQFLHTVYQAVTSSPNWERTVMVINFDEWGGFYDHVAPEVAPDSRPKFAQRGFRVPCMVVSPLARRGFVAHDTYDHASVLKMIEWGFDLKPLAVRDAQANNLADVLDLSGKVDTSFPTWDFPDVQLQDCTQFLADEIFAALADRARGLGFPVP
jgi:phospholipase C